MKYIYFFSFYFTKTDFNRLITGFGSMEVSTNLEITFIEQIYKYANGIKEKESFENVTVLHYQFLRTETDAKEAKNRAERIEILTGK